MERHGQVEEGKLWTRESRRSIDTGMEEEDKYADKTEEKGKL